MPKIKSEKSNAEELLRMKRAAQNEHYKRLREGRESGFDLMKKSAPLFNERFGKSKISF